MCDYDISAANGRFASTNYFIQADEAVRMMRAWETEHADLPSVGTFILDNGGAIHVDFYHG
jgi:hypothetical protein